MTDDHTHAFIHEAEEGITELNNALLTLEGDPEDGAAMDSIFRTAHTLKGNAAAMGYGDASGLAHALEDLLDEVRDDEIRITPELMDLLFAGVDELELMLGEIAADGESHTDPSETEERVRAVIEAGGIGGDAGTDGAGEADSDVDGGDDANGDGDVEVGGDDDAEVDGGGDADADSDDDAGDGDADSDVDAAEAERLLAPERGRALAALAAESGGRILHARVSVGDSAMKGVDGMFAVGAVERAFDAFETAPERGAIEEGEYDEAFDVFVAGDADAGAVTSVLDGVTQVESVVVTDVTDAFDADADAGASGTPDGPKSTDAGDAEVVEALEAVENSAEGGSAENDESAADAAGAGEEDEAGSGSTPSTASTSGSKRSDITSVRVDVDRLDELYGLVEQLVTSRIKLRREMDDAGTDKSENLDELDKISSNLQNTVMDMRLIPLKKVVDTFPRLVRDVARDQEKEVAFDIEGEDIELDRTILTEIRDPLMHVLRNAVDHGIESPAEREAAGKPPQGTIELTATRERDHVTIRVADDGAGLDVERLREKAAEKGVKTRGELAEMDDSEVYDLVFHPGFSTADEVTDISGRGVGMDVVHSTVKQLDGTVSVDSEAGEGTTVSLRLPVTVAIVKVMFVEVGGTEYGIPVKNIDEVARARDVRTVNGREVIEHDDEIYPVVRLAEVLGEIDAGGGPAAAATDGGSVVDGSTAAGSTAGAAATEGSATEGTDGGMLLRIRSEKRPVALHCDAVLDQEEVVVKPLEGVLSGIPGLSGTAVLGDGDVVTILDVVTL